MSLPDPRVRRSHHRARALLLAALTAFIAPYVPAAAEPAADSLGATVATEAFTLEVEHKPKLTVRRIEPKANGLVLVTISDGSRRWIGAHRITAIRDEGGHDRTDEVLIRGRYLGAAPERTPHAHPPWMARRFRGGPGSVCGTYFLTEFTVLGRVDSGDSREDPDGIYYTSDIGVARNIGTRYSVGGTLFLAAGDDHQESGLRP